MFSKGKSSPPDKTPPQTQPPLSAQGRGSGEGPLPAHMLQPIASPGPKPSPSLLASDITVTGNVSTAGDIQIDGVIEGDVRAHLLTVGENATIRGEVIADDVVVNGHVIGRLRGLKVRLTATARVEGDIIHKSIAIESGAHFEGSVQRREDPLGDGAPPQEPLRLGPASPAPGPDGAAPVADPADAEG